VIRAKLGLSENRAAVRAFLEALTGVLPASRRHDGPERDTPNRGWRGPGRRS
jgi:hypothetical protein